MTEARKYIWLYRKLFRTVTLIAAALSILASCTAGPGAKPPGENAEEPPEVVTPEPTLVGTWRGTGDYWLHDDRTDDYYVAGTEIITLTFTKDRYIYVHSGTLFDGTEGGTGQNSGTWQATETTVTKTENVDHDDQEATPRIDVSVGKTYYLLGKSGNVLYMHDFGDSEPVNTFRRYERVENTLPPTSLAGVWTNTQTEEDGTIETKTITIGLDGTIQYREVGTPIDGDPWESEINAKLELDVANYYLDLIDSTNVDGYPIMESRIAFAPTENSPTEIAVSPHWNESVSNEHYHKYGNYYLRFTRQAASQE